MSSCRLILEEPPARWQLQESAYIVGRRPNCGICLDFPSVSREHARLERKPQGWCVQDLGSANGTLLNGVPVTSMTPLRQGDRLQLGKRVLRFEEDYPFSGCGPPPTETDGRTIVSQPESRPVIMLVADLQGFTEGACLMESSELAAGVRDWCEGCGNILSTHGACLDKFIGDAVFAWWQGGDQELRRQSLAAAREILSMPSPVGSGPLRCGAALHCGMVALCRLPNNSHTLLGSAVNITFRMESLTRQLHQPLLVSPSFAEGYPDSETVFISHGRHQVKGVEDLIEVLVPQSANLPP